MASRLVALVQASTLKIADDKFRCMRCGKHFRGCDYVQKHFRKVRGDAIQVLLHEAWQEAAEAAYSEDLQRPRFFLDLHEQLLAELVGAASLTWL